MIEAILHSKVPEELRNHEDCLTSNVWGLLKYRQLRPALVRFLSKARLYKDESIRLGERISESLLNADQAQVSFWPSYRDFGQPDILILSHDLALVVEVKYMTTLSGVDQLRKYNELLNRKHSNKTHRHVVYLTADWAAPSLDAEATTGLETSLWWLSWYDLLDAIREASVISSLDKEICNDLNRYLAYLGFQWFDGIRAPKIKPLTTIFWHDVVPIISEYEDQPKVKQYFWEEKKL